MRVLKFNVNGQIIEQDPNCDFSNLVPGSEQYLFAKFSFSREWGGCAKVAAFYSVLGHEYPPQILQYESMDMCAIPAEACANKTFKIRIIGKHPNGLRLKTNRIVVNQNGGK